MTNPDSPSVSKTRGWRRVARLLVLLFVVAGLPVVARSLVSSPVAPQFPRDPQLAQLSTRGMWIDITPDALPVSGLARQIAGDFRTLVLNRSEMQALLDATPLESTNAALNTAIVVELPWPTGGMRRFRVEYSPIMEPALAARFPEIRTYRGRGLDDLTASVRLDMTPFGFHAMVLSADGTVYIDPRIQGDASYYLSFFRRDVQRGDATAFTCGVTSVGDELRYRRDQDQYQPAHGTQLRTYRAAVAATVEYTAFYGGTVGGALAGMTTTMNRVNGIYERDLSVRMNLVANNNAVIFTAEPDPYTNNDGFTMLGENQANLDSVIGTANYDIGHVFSTGGGGVATLRSPCAAGIKAQGVTGLPSPTGDVFAVDYVAHEIGHQFGGNHTFNGTTGACGGGNRNASSAYEPGSGSTIQAYAGICGAENLQSNSDAYFHAKSLDEIIAFITDATSGGSCPVTTLTGNTPPTVSAWPDITIPMSTPFELRASGTDADGDTVTYAWEQYNLGPASPPNTDDGTRPIFRSFAPSASLTRTMPKLTDLLNNVSTFGESLPTTTRALLFRVTARDGRGGTASDDMTVNVTSTSGPFVVTSQGTAVTYPGLSGQTVTWNPAGTVAAPVFVQVVEISLSTDGGLTFPHVLGVTSNDGSHSVMLPNIATTAARIKVAAQGSGHFFAINQANFTIMQIPAITHAPQDLRFGATRDGAAGALVHVTPPQAVTVSYTTGAPPVWTASSNRPWIVISNGSGVGAGQFFVSVENPGAVPTGGIVRGTVTISSPTTGSVGVPVTLTVQQVPGTSAVAFGQVDTPAQGAAGQQGAIGMTGWALDDIGVDAINVYRPCLTFDDPASCQLVQGNNLVFVGNGVFLAGARPDVEEWVGSTTPMAHRAGWGFQILTNMLPHIPSNATTGGQGTFPLYAYAADVEGHQTLLGRTILDNTPTTIAVANDSIAKPFGTIDTPLLGATISGVAANFGWVLTPDTNTVPDGTDILMPLNGSTVTVYIDGVATAAVAYNQCRGNVGNPPPGGVFCNDDIANIFGNLAPAAPLTPRASNPTRYRNLDAARGAIGAYNINTLALTNGLHTIAWGVSDSAGRGEGIGSRFFTVLNGGAVSERPPSPSASARPAETALSDLLDAPAQSRGSATSLAGLRRSGRLVSAREGFNPATPMQEIARRSDGVRTLTLPSSGRAELGFAAPVAGGYLVANGQLRDLPVGSHLDRRTGVFTWNPPPQYTGTYRLVFVMSGERVDVDVTVK